MEKGEEQNKYWYAKIHEIENITKECNKACMECLLCPHNQNSQFNLILQNLFNWWKDINKIKWIDINSSCDLH